MTDKQLAILVIAFLEALALWLRVDGAYFSMVIGIIAGLVGYSIGKKSQSNNNGD
jgi:hypothetical protein